MKWEWERIWSDFVVIVAARSAAAVAKRVFFVFFLFQKFEKTKSSKAAAFGVFFFSSFMLIYTNFMVLKSIEIRVRENIGSWVCGLEMEAQ